MTARLARCLKCGAYSLLDTGGPVAFAVGVAAVDRDGYIDALGGRKALYTAEKGQNGAVKLRPRPPGTPAPPFTPEGAQIGADGLVHAEHPCPARDQRPVNTSTGKDSAPATPGAAGAGNRRRAAPVAGTSPPGRPSPATTATPLLSEVRGPCGVCGRMIKPGEIYWSIVHGHLWIDGEHEECP